MSVSIRTVNYQTALNFFLDERAFQDHVTMTTKGEWFGAFVDGEADPCGIVSTQMIGRWKRVKTLYVAKKKRRQGVATALVRHVADANCTAFAFDASRPVFEGAGFEREKVGKNGIHFMRRKTS